MELRDVLEEAEGGWWNDTMTNKRLKGQFKAMSKETLEKEVLKLWAAIPQNRRSWGKPEVRFLIRTWFRATQELGRRSL